MIAIRIMALSLSSFLLPHVISFSEAAERRVHSRTSIDGSSRRSSIHRREAAASFHHQPLDLLG
jgi:hypothetical protein